MPKTKILVTSMTYRTEFNLSLLSPEFLTLFVILMDGWLIRKYHVYYIYTDRRMTCNILGRRSRACLVRFYSCSIRFGQCTQTKKLSFFHLFFSRLLYFRCNNTSRNRLIVLRTETNARIGTIYAHVPKYVYLPTIYNIIIITLFIRIPTVYIIQVHVVITSLIILCKQVHNSTI